ncbi:MAG: M15 family metallopeptidase [Lachnospira sp.]|nr:M15 family metallopeptidase [Lachnospira sp.]
MRRRIHCKMLAAVLLAALTLSSLTACGKGDDSSTQNATAVIENNQSEENSGNTTAASSTESQEMENVVAANAPGVVGTSSKGYAIQNINGATYVNGILIVNKSYSLPASFAPGGITQEVQNAFNQMEADARAQGLNIWIQSSYRSYDYQVSIYNSYVAQDGKALADTYSARPGYSEHQSGLCFDLNSIDDSFTDTPEGKWVDAHAHEYGFVIRFPKGKEAVTGYQYESWHLRYVGLEYAKIMHDNNLCLEEFLGVTSEYAD